MTDRREPNLQSVPDTYDELCRSQELALVSNRHSLADAIESQLRSLERLWLEFARRRSGEA